MTDIKRKVVLASASPQRARILKELGLKFTICPSRVKETRSIKTTCAGLVKENALRKAEAVAKRLKEGLVIGVDTVVLVRGKVIGKPRNKSEARNFLELITEYPNWVYSGVSVIDIDRNKTYTACEKTKVVFRKPGKDEFEDLLREEVKFDRAGGIDIEGKAGDFVKEIRGDFFNIVGLPLNTLKTIMSKVNKYD